MYVPLICFFIWMLVMTAELIKAINKDSDAVPRPATNGQPAAVPGRTPTPASI
jgi:hypothetical protein